MQNKVTAPFKRTLIAATLLTVFASGHVKADATTGHISGQTITYNDAPVEGVEITIINVDTGYSKTITSDDDGKYRFPLLPAGTYNIIAHKDGYLVTEQNNVDVNIGGKTLINIGMNEEGVERIEVRATTIAAIDTTNTESGLVISKDELELLPVPRDMSSVALLAPGTNKGDAAFGNLVSFPGASVAENAYYIDGINITDVRTGLGFSQLPWEMFQDFQVKTGAFSAEYGRAVGIISATTKSGTNEFQGGVNARYIPDELREDRPDVKRTDIGAELYGTEYFAINHGRTYDKVDLDIWASGPIIKDKLFFYAIYNPLFETRENASLWRYTETDSDDAIWATKFNWNISDDHRLDFTYFNDEREYEVSSKPYDLTNKVIGSYYFKPSIDAEDANHGRVVTPIVGNNFGSYEQVEGGENYSLKYTGYFLDGDLTMSAMLGHNESQISNRSLVNEGQTRIIDSKTGIILHGPSVGNFGTSRNERDQFRVDFDYFWGDHEFRFGVDIEELEAYENRDAYGSGTYTMSVGTDNLIDYLEGSTDVIYQQDSAIIQSVDLNNNGTYETENFAVYIQDEWQIADNVVLNLGLRYDEFTNKNIEGDDFINMDGQIAPRLGLAWDIFGDGESVFTASFGRFYLPVATNTNIRLAGKELYIIKRDFQFDSIPASEFENIADILGNSEADLIAADGTLKDTRRLVDADIDPMYQDEYTMSFEQQWDDYVWGIRGTYRELGESIEDVTVQRGLEKYLDEVFDEDCPACAGSQAAMYVLTNPGSSVDIWVDTDDYVDENGNLVKGPKEARNFVIPNEYLEYPKAERKYIAWDLKLTRPWQDDFTFSATYTWSHSWGNTEGLVDSDIGQRDAGATQSFDYAALMDHSYGDLPNDRRHTFKLTGAYAFNEEWSVGFNATWQTGRPNNCFGYHPDAGAVPSIYGPTSFYCEEEVIDPDSDPENPEYIAESVPSPRGSKGRTPTTFVLDLSLTYKTTIMGLDTRAQLQVQNVFNEIEATRYFETGEVSDITLPRLKEINPEMIANTHPDYGLVSSTTAPRYVELSISARF
ncbi:TonB-dependent receptor [Thalassotalea sp. HSM 43]|uniref:TonB-dependent receptor n=1 Tax=Thalassotalea sp. HSM 43 TaxID=2552945 RepID=UPI00108032AA|nr:TonB-dependent receptor [Thalassotalea sp. HSM 43]QBY03370.1 TonB-dependent receptor [Thalassotalea sp. HSM 43]